MPSFSSSLDPIGPHWTRWTPLFRLKLGMSGGVQGHGTDHTKTLSRTLAGFGLTWPRKVHFSTFDGKLGVPHYLLMLEACLMVHGSRLMAHGQGRPGEAHGQMPPRPWGPRGALSVRVRPRALWVPKAGPAPGHEPPLASLGHEP